MPIAPEDRPEWLERLVVEPERTLSDLARVVQSDRLSMQPNQVMYVNDDMLNSSQVGAIADALDYSEGDLETRKMMARAYIQTACLQTVVDLDEY